MLQFFFGYLLWANIQRSVHFMGVALVSIGVLRLVMAVGAVRSR